MSAANGGRGAPPVPPEGHGPPQEAIAISKRVIQQSQGTRAERDGNGGSISFLVVEAGQAVEYTYLIGEPGKKAILEELAGGITLP